MTLMTDFMLDIQLQLHGANVIAFDRRPLKFRVLSPENSVP